jgi:hypothetical protein
MAYCEGGVLGVGSIWVSLCGALRLSAFVRSINWIILPSGSMRSGTSSHSLASSSVGDDPELCCTRIGALVAAIIAAIKGGRHFLTAHVTSSSKVEDNGTAVREGRVVNVNVWC